MSFNNVAKISFVAALAIGANAAENVTLSGVEVTSTGGGYGVDDVKISTRNAGILKRRHARYSRRLCRRHERYESKNLYEGG